MVEAPTSPSGTVTFLFTDIEGSTRRWQADQDEMAGSLAEHDATLARIIASHDGHLFKHTGDGSCAVFQSPLNAIDAAVAAQAALLLPVRMGVHTGEAIERDGDYFGPTLNRCARIMDTGHGGQILASSATVALCPGLDVVDLGEHRLKDLDAPETIYQVGSGDFPALRVNSADTLPAHLTSLVGREALVDDIVARASEHRLVTLVGFGGVGKTRAAVAAAHELARDFDRAVFVDLGLAGDSADVLPTVSRALGVTLAATESIVMSLSARPVLLVLDNCEHVLDEVADLVEEVLERSADVHILATSREALVVDGEVLVAVPGLGCDGPDSPAVQLFLDRARAATPDFRADAAELLVVQELCERLDRMPLAIELAAARATTMSPKELIQRLDDRFDVLTGGRRRRRRDRHQTLRQTIDWSYDLLENDEQRVFATLAVFGGEFDLSGAAAVNSDMAEFDLLDILGALVDKSLLTVTRTRLGSSYRYLETIRSYADDRLDETGQRDAAMQAMQRHLIDLLRESVAAIWTSEADDAFARLRAEMPNFRRALDSALDAADVDTAAALVAPRAQMLTFGHVGIDGWADEVLALPGIEDHPAQQDLLTLRTMDLHFSGRFSEEVSGGSEALAAGGGPDNSPWWVLFQYAFYCQIGGLGDEVVPTAMKGARVADHDAGALMCRILAYTSLLARLADIDPRTAEDISADLAAAGSHDSSLVRGWAAFCRSWQARAETDYESMLVASLETADSLHGDAAFWNGAMFNAALAQLGLGLPLEAIASADQGTDYARRVGRPSELLGSIGIYALAMQALDEPRAAAVLRGWLPRRLTFLYTQEMPALDQWLDGVVPADELADLKQRGREMTPDELYELTHEVIRTPR